MAQAKKTTTKVTTKTNTKAAPIKQPSKTTKTPVKVEPTPKKTTKSKGVQFEESKFKENILPIKASTQFKDDYTRYGVHVMYARVIPDYRDGFKPIHRRILWAMYNDCHATNNMVKSATVVGSVMGEYHAHGDCIFGSTVISILTDSGWEDRTIEELYNEGNDSYKVFSINQDTKQTEIGTMTNVRIGQYSNTIYNVEMSTGVVIKCTENHPFMLDDYSFVKIKDFDINTMKLWEVDNEDLSIKSITVDYLDKEIPMYDFNVDGYENVVIPCGNNMYICIHNSAIYGSIKPLVNWFESKVPLIDKQGDFGSFQGDQAAAYRYTECKLNKFAMEYVLGDLRESKHSIDWTANYKNTCMEPQFLPSKIPLLLVNGAFGIGVGKKPEIPTHNLAEVIDATIALIKNPNTLITLVPDHCMACDIVNTDFDAISKTGYGYYTVRGRVDIVDYTKNHYKNRTALIIRSVPNLTFLNSITEAIEDMVEKKKIVQIDDMFDESHGDEMAYVIILKPGADPEFVRRMIYKNTSLEQSCRVNFEALNGLNPVRFNYRSYLLSFIDQRKLVKFRVYSNKLQDVQTKYSEREAYIKALQSGDIDNIIKKIRARKTQEDDAALAEYLVRTLKITTLQANYIINLPLKRLAMSNLPKYKEEAKQLIALRDEYLSIILDEKKILRIIVNELEKCKAEYGVPRTCRIVESDGSNNVPKGAMNVAITEKNFVLKVPFGSNIPSIRGDSIKEIIPIDNTDNLLIFDNIGKVFKLAVNKIPFGDKGTDIRFLIKGLTANIAFCCPQSIFENTADGKKYIVTLTKLGYIKRMEFEDFVNIPSSGLIYAKLDEGDFIQSIKVTVNGAHILVFSDKKAMNVPIDMVPIMKRNARGSRTFRNNFVDGMSILPPRDSLAYTKAYLIVITDGGRVNKLPIVALSGLDNFKKAFNVIKIGKSDFIRDILIVDDSCTISIKTITEIDNLPVNMIPTGSTISPGERLLNTTKDKIIRAYVTQTK